MTVAVMDRTPVGTSEPGTAYRQTFARVVRSEWIKARSLRGTWLTCGLLALVMVGVAALAGILITAAPGQASDPLATVLGGSDLAVMIAGVLGSMGPDPVSRTR
ncbi:hypothetical protein ET495_08130 [Xylanimonas allomyrinae]|uniref:Uncharacterized protein n=1 Tax=Xylanimonas allomyrinae TaxID=2509459 RepID=A0A4P6ENC2_9MICO|nr:hypothetical protein [Xylanimonas allomyrinae]QAY63213.1 hypothetical protein ET495_08130 [Xylanimonas allomyrinae]